MLKCPSQDLNPGPGLDLPKAAGVPASKKMSRPGFEPWPWLGSVSKAQIKAAGVPATQTGAPYDEVEIYHI